MNEEQIKALIKLVQKFEQYEDEQSYKELSEFLAKWVPNFREVYHLVSSAAYADWSASE